MYAWFQRQSVGAGLAAFILAAIALAGCSSPEERAKSYYEHGKQLLAAHDNQRAEIEFRNAVKYNKNLLPAWQGLAEVEEQTHNWSGLVPVYRTILGLDANDLSIRLKLARLLLLGRAYDDALRALNDVKENDSQNADLLALKAAILFKLKDPDGSTREAEAALKVDPNNAGAMFVLAGDHFARGDTKGALAILDSQEMPKSENTKADVFKVQIFEQTQDLPQAESALKRLIERNPKDLSFRKELIRLYLFQHRPDDAEKEQREIVAADPTNSRAQLDLVRLLNVTKGAAVARQQLDALISAGGDVFPYQLASAQLSLAKGDFAQGVESLKSLISGASSPEHALSARIVLAEAYLSKKQLQEAEAVVADILAKDARNTAGLKFRASIRMERGQLDLAIADLRQALNDKPRAADLMLMLAIAYERSGSIDLAEKEFADAMRVSNFDPSVTLNYVGFLRRRGSIEHAEDVLVDLASRWPKNLEVLQALAQIRLERREWVGAQQVAEAMRRLGANRVATDELLGAALAGQTKYDESIVALQDAYSAAPAAAQPMKALVTTYIRAGKTDQAITFLQSVLKANPSNVEAYVLLGSAQLANKSLAQAQQSFLTAVEKGPTNVVGYIALADFYAAQKKTDEALKTARAGLKAQPDNFAMRLTLAGMLERTDDYEAAISEYEKLIDRDPGSIIVANNLASLLADYRTDKPSLDRAAALAAILVKSPLAQFKDTQGWVDYRQGNYKAAVPLLEEAAAALPNRPLVRYHLGMSYAAAGQPEKSAEQLKMALNQGPDHELEQKIHAALTKTGTQ